MKRICQDYEKSCPDLSAGTCLFFYNRHIAYIEEPLTLSLWM